MGRRALRKIDPALDLAPYFKTFDQLPQPWDAAVLFGRSGPVEVDVGCGKGLFTFTAADARSDTNFLGIEISSKYARFAAARLAKDQLYNACIVCGDAKRIFRELFPNGVIRAVHVYFPDPWWKKRHRKRRVLSESFVRDIERALMPGGTFHFWTDVKEYFDVSLELLTTKTMLTGPISVDELLPEHDMDYRTHFERRTRLEDQTVYRAKFNKAAN